MESGLGNVFDGTAVTKEDERFLEREISSALERMKHLPGERGLTEKPVVLLKNPQSEGFFAAQPTVWRGPNKGRDLKVRNVKVLEEIDSQYGLVEIVRNHQGGALELLLSDSVSPFVPRPEVLGLMGEFEEELQGERLDTKKGGKAFLQLYNLFRRGDLEAVEETLNAMEEQEDVLLLILTRQAQDLKVRRDTWSDNETFLSRMRDLVGKIRA